MEAGRGHCSRWWKAILHLRKQASSKAFDNVFKAIASGDREETVPKLIADAVAFEFEYVYTLELHGLLSRLLALSEVTLSDLNFTVDDIFQLLSTLDNSVSMGPDGIPAIFLKNRAHTLAPALYRLCQ